jgi:lipoate-protein ligase A
MWLCSRPHAVKALGRFQNLDEINAQACTRAGVELARRPTGGKAILHLDDFTYSIIIPAGWGLPKNTFEAYALLSGGIIFALRSFGFDTVIDSSVEQAYEKAGAACFAATTGADLRYEGRKICGSAQVRRNGSVLQHGSLLLRDNSRLMFDLLRFDDDEVKEKARVAFCHSYVPLYEIDTDISWQSLARAFVQGFSESFGVDLVEGGLTPWEESCWQRGLQAAEAIS